MDGLLKPITITNGLTTVEIAIMDGKIRMPMDGEILIMDGIIKHKTQTIGITSIKIITCIVQMEIFRACPITIMYWKQA
jgi:hypothetical protein